MVKHVYPDEAQKDVAEEPAVGLESRVALYGVGLVHLACVLLALRLSGMGRLSAGYFVP